VPRDSGNPTEGERVEQVVALGLWSKLLYLFIVPLLFTLLLTLILGTSLGIFDFSSQLQGAQMWLHNLPLVGAWIPEPGDLPLDDQTPWEQIRKEIEAQWEDIERERAINAQRSEDLDSRERLLADASALFNQAQAQRQSRDLLISKLVSVIETMRPDSAAEVFNELDIETAVEIMNNMDTNRSARIYNLMDPVKASLIIQRTRR